MFYSEQVPSHVEAQVFEVGIVSLNRVGSSPSASSAQSTLSEKKPVPGGQQFAHQGWETWRIDTRRVQGGRTRLLV